MFKKITLGAALAASTLAVAPAPALASHDGYYDSRYERSHRGDNYYRGRNYRSCKGTTGLVVGGAGGALLGREIAGRGSRGTGTILGAAAGALLGREIAKSSCRSRRY